METATIAGETYERIIATLTVEREGDTVTLSALDEHGCLSTRFELTRRQAIHLAARLIGESR